MKVAVVNKYFPLEGKVNCLYDILRSVSIDTSLLSSKNLSLYEEIRKEK
jgi:hypothetical protein